MLNKFGQHDHGEELVVDLSNPRTKDIFKNLADLTAPANEFVAIMSLAILSDPKRRMTLPCKKCLLDTALQFRDIGALLEELANGK